MRTKSSFYMLYTFALFYLNVGTVVTLLLKWTTVGEGAPKLLLNLKEMHYNHRQQAGTSYIAKDKRVVACIQVCKKTKV